MLESIVDYLKYDKAITAPDQKVVHIGWSFMRQSTIGWKLWVQWRDGSTLWQALKYLKESHPVETAENDEAQEIDNETAFNWWVKSVLKKRLRIMPLCQEEERSIPQEDSQVWDRGA